MEAEALPRLYETLFHYAAWALGVLAGLCYLFTGVLLALLRRQELAADTKRARAVEKTASSR